MRESLIDKAAKLCGDDDKLAKAIGASNTLVSRMRSGQRTLTPKWILRMCALLGEDATPYLLDEIARRHKP
jgi:DNA-binding transcriptional regulator YdaS (Cro superfamily)